MPALIASCVIILIASYYAFRREIRERYGRWRVDTQHYYHGELNGYYVGRQRFLTRYGAAQYAANQRLSHITTVDHPYRWVFTVCKDEIPHRRYNP